MSWGTKWAREKVERARRAVVDAERRLAKAQEAIAKANAGVLRAERHLGSPKRKLTRAGQRAAALEAERAAVSVRARAMAERVIEGRTLQQIGDEWGISKDRVRQIVVGTAGGPPGGRPASAGLEGVLAFAGADEVLFHAAGANAADAQRFSMFRVFHSVDVTNVLNLAHLANMSGAAEVLDINAGPSLVGNAGLRPFPGCGHASNPSALRASVSCARRHSLSHRA